MKKVVFIGKNGQLGKSFQDYTAKKIKGDFSFYYFSKEELNITNPKDINRVFSEVRPEFCINAAAYTNVDKCEYDYEKANLINNVAVRNLTKACNDFNCFMIHISTDYVFDGNSKRLYQENDKPNPINNYGITKYNGENSIIKMCSQYIIIRTSWVYGPYKNNFLKTMLKNADNQKELKIVYDQIGTPTYSYDICNAIEKVLDKPISNKLKPNIFHYSSNKPISWYDFSLEIFKQAKKFDYKTPKKYKTNKFN